jgi:chromosome partitioning protein
LAVITMLNQKGGVGKTSACYHLAGTLSQLGRRVLLVDNDPQSSLTQGFLGPQATRQLEPAGTIAGVYSQDAIPGLAIRPSGLNGVDLVAGSRHAALFNTPAPHTADWPLQVALREFLADVAGGYDTVLIDCPPNLHLCSWAALVASDALVVPLQPEDFGAQGIADVMESVALARSGPNPSLVELGYLVTMVNTRTAVHRGYEQRLRSIYGAAVFDSMIPHSVDFKEALMARKPVSVYKPRGAAAKAMKALAEELAARLAGREDGARTEAA